MARFSGVARALVLVLLTAFVVFCAALISSRLALRFDTPGILILVALALIAAAVYEPIRRLTNKALKIIFQQTTLDAEARQLIADLKRMNQEMSSLNLSLEYAKESAEKLDSVKTDFVTIASHELRTPLSQVRGYTDIIDALNEQGMLDSEQTASIVNNLRKAIDRMEELVSNMLDVSQLDVAAMDLRFTQITIESAMRVAIEPLNDAIRQRKLTLSARGLRGLPPIQGDMQRLVQAFRNIVVNAIKFTPDGGRIEINGSLVPEKLAGEGAHVLIAIADTGVGIDRDNLELIFKKFFRGTDPAYHSTGTYKFMGAGPGLGLTIARGVIAGHNGEIWVESEGFSMTDLPGSTFYIMLPINPPATVRKVAIEPQTGTSERNERLRSKL